MKAERSEGHLPDVGFKASGGKEAPYISIVIYPSQDKAPAAQKITTINTLALFPS